MSTRLQYDEEGNRRRIATLRENGVDVWSAERVFVSADVPLDAIEPGCTLMNAVISGPETMIGRNSRVGVSGPAILENVKAGHGVELGAGTYSACVLMDRVKIRGFAEIRRGTVLEEEAEAGHNVGLKNAIFTAAVVAGSCINFCDVLVTGGTSRSDHTEIGSGAIHFNFSPKRDKFASLIGDVTGVLARSVRVFVGGNTGIIAPAHIEFGAIVPAGSTVRGCAAEYDAIASREGYCDDTFCRNVFLGTTFVANLKALGAWYRQVRLCTASPFEVQMCEGAMRQIGYNFDFRRTELVRYLDRIAGDSGRRKHIVKCAEGACGMSQGWNFNSPDQPPPAELVSEYRGLRRTLDHQAAVKALSADSTSRTVSWLKLMVAGFREPVTSLMRKMGGRS
jgi:hypothetical protein